MLLPGPQMLVYLVLWVIMPREAGAISRGGRCHSKADSPSSQRSALQRMGHRHADKGASLVPKREALLFERRLVAKHLVLVPGLLVSVLLSGCGASDEEQVRETIKRFNRAAAEGDGKEACDQLTPGAQATGGLRCESVIDQLGRLGGKAAKRRLAAVEVRNVTVSGKTAMAEAQVPTQSPTMLQLEKVPRRVFRWKTSDGEWKIASLGPGPGGGF
jgi:hypothetical protein